MEVILMEKVDKLGKEGDIVKVSEGYARNFLLSKGKAKIVSKDAINQLEALKKRKAKELATEIQIAKELAAKIEKLSCTFDVQAGEDDKLFGSITVADIAAALEKEGISVDKRKVLLEEPIKTIGVTSVLIKLHTEVTATLKIWVVKK